MDFNPNNYLREVFSQVLQSVDSKLAVKNAVSMAGNILFVAESEFSFNRISKIYAVSIGKAALKMALAIDSILGDKLIGGVISTPKFDAKNPATKWRIFHGGHPVPNVESLATARFTTELLQKIDSPQTLIIFLISGGGSAMFEILKDERITLADLQKTNEILVSCGATIAEINAIRRRISAVKGGGLSRFAPNSKKISLIISDTNSGQAFNVASGLTIENKDDFSGSELKTIISRYQLAEKLPAMVFECLKNEILLEPIKKSSGAPNHQYSVLLENRSALLEATKQLENKGFIVKIAEDLVEQEIGEGCRNGVENLLKLFEKNNKKPVALVSGGEFVCPVRGLGIGGRNLESALRTAILFDELKNKHSKSNFIGLFAGTDGIDGNSPATGATCDQTTLERAERMNLNAKEFLVNSDSYSFFHALNDAIITGTTGTNVRDVRILLAL